MSETSPNPNRTIVTVGSGSSPNIYQTSPFSLLDSLAYLFSSIDFQSEGPNSSSFPIYSPPTCLFGQTLDQLPKIPPPRRQTRSTSGSPSLFFLHPPTSHSRSASVPPLPHRQDLEWNTSTLRAPPASSSPPSSVHRLPRAPQETSATARPLPSPCSPCSLLSLLPRPHSSPSTPSRLSLQEATRTPPPWMGETRAEPQAPAPPGSPATSGFPCFVLAAVGAPVAAAMASSSARAPASRTAVPPRLDCLDPPLHHPGAPPSP